MSLLRYDFLRGRHIGISISESPELEALGLSQAHLQDAMIEFARHLLAGGATLSYGGRLRPGGFTELLLGLARTYGGISDSRSVVSYLAWPDWLQLTPASRAHLMNVAELREIEPPPGLVDDPRVLPPPSPRARFIRAQALTAMREAMNRDIDARILLGGKLEGYSGKMPGLLEEAVLALRSGKPLFLLGGFGGCTAAIVAALRGERPEALSDGWQRLNRQHGIDDYNARVEQASTGERVDYDALVGWLEGRGLSALNNGLDARENEVLARTLFVPEMISLVLKGLARGSAERGPE